MSSNPHHGSISRAPSRIIFLIGLLLIVFITWAANTQIDEVARAEGRVIPSSKIQTIQSSEAGTVKEILIREGQRVKKGQIMVRLDDTMISSTLGESKAKATALKAQIARLQIEYEGGGKKPFQCPIDIKHINPRICKNEDNLLHVRYENYNNKVSVLQERAEQRKKELSEILANIDRLGDNVKHAKKKLDLLAPLAAQNLISQTDLIEAQQQASESQGQLIAAKEQRGRVESGLREAQVQIKEASSFFRQEALKEMTQKLSELSIVEETLKGAKERVSHTDIRSPVAGIVNKLNITTIGGFVQAGFNILDVVPMGDKLLVEVKLKPEDIAFVRPGQKALIKITSYDFSIYGGLDGNLYHVSADSILDKDSKEAFYIGLISTQNSYIEHNQKKFPIMPGMICQVDILTGRKSILDYLLKPVNKARREAFGER